MSCDILFAYVPPYIPFVSDSTFPVLAGYLRERGVRARIVDLNIAWYKRLLTARYLDSLGHEMRAELPAAWRGNREKAKARIKAMIALPWVSRCIGDAVLTMKDKDRFYHLGGYHRSRVLIKAAMAIVNARYWPSKLTFWQFITGRDLISDSISPVPEKDMNMFAAFFEQAVRERIAPLGPAAIGITAPSPFHLPAALTLSGVIRRELPHVKIILGGPVVTSACDEVFYEKWLEFAHVLVHGEGEPALLPLLEALQSHGDLKKVPNIIYRKKGRVRKNNLGSTVDVSTLPPPLYDDIEARDYLSPEPFFSVTTSRGCTWRRCAFCCRTSHGRRFRQRRTDSVMADIAFLAQRYGARNLFFTDEVTSPSMLKKLSAAILEAGWNMRWSTQARCDPAPSPAEAGKMLKSGCLHLILGIESIVPRTLKRMDKGFGADAVVRMIDRLQATGIGVHAYAMVGFPGEERGEAAKTLHYLLRMNRRWGEEGFTFQASPFVAMAGSRATDDPETFRLEDLEVMLANVYAYRPAQGLDQAGAMEIISEIFGNKTDLASRGSRLYKTPCFAHKLLFLDRYPPGSVLLPRNRTRFSPAALVKQELLSRLSPAALLVSESAFEWY